MPDNRDVRSNNDLRDLNAVFVADDAGGLSSTHNIGLSRGAHTLRIPAVFVPEGCTPPGYPYIPFGRMTLDSGQDGGAEQTPGSDWQTALAMGTTRQATPSVQSPPRTRVNARGDPPVAPGADLRGGQDPGSTSHQGLAQSSLTLIHQHSRAIAAAGTSARMALNSFGLPRHASDAGGSGGGIAGSVWQAPVNGGDQAPRGLDTSNDAIEAAMRALSVTPTDGRPAQSFGWATLANWPGSSLSGEEATDELAEVANGDAIATPLVSTVESERSEKTDRTSNSFGQGTAVTLPNGSMVPDAHSSTGQ